MQRGNSYWVALFQKQPRVSGLRAFVFAQSRLSLLAYVAAVLLLIFNTAWGPEKWLAEHVGMWQCQCQL